MRHMTALKSLYRDLCRSTTSSLEDVFARGVRPDPEALCGFEYYGYNTAPIAGVLGIRKFKKAFYARQGARTAVGGYNCKVRPSPLDAGWVNGGPGGTYQGYYDVREGDEGASVAKHPNALYLDYGSVKANSLLDGSFLRDFLVQPDPNDADVFLGKAYASLGPVTLPVSFFVLQRAHRMTQPSSFRSPE